MDNNNTHLHQNTNGGNGMNKWPSPNYEQQRQQQERYSIKATTITAPRLLTLSPSHGAAGTTITIVLQDLPLRPVKLAFNSLVVDTKQLPSQNGTMTTLLATIPSYETTLSTTSTVPISVCFLGDNGIIQDTFFVTKFVYTLEPQQNNAIQQQYHYERKRSFDFCAVDEDNLSNKRSTQEGMQYTYGSDMGFSPYDRMGMPSPYPHYFQRRVDEHNTMAPVAPQPQQQQRYQQPSCSMEMESPVQAQEQQQQSSFSSERRPSSHRPSVHLLKSTSYLPSTTVANYQPYPGLVSPNNFELTDDLDTMMHNWTPMEQQQGRRLVRFWREDNNESIEEDLIKCGCQPVSQTDAAALDTNNTIVSCIYWPEHDDYFITSVDCIYLLESLMKTHFGVEEKNRIRRNLEGFRPQTVAKSKPISAEFFKRVMGFPHPKPRNIEKDIKAFHWKILPFALKKIITKYSVATHTDAPPSGLYSSSVATLTTPARQQQQQQQHMRSSSHPSSLLPPSTSTDATPSCSTSTSSSTASSSSLSLSSPSSTSSLSTIPSTYPNEDAYLQQQNKHQVYYNHPTAKGCHHEHRIYTAAGGISASSLTSTASSSPSPSLQYHNESTSASPVLPPSATSYGSNAFPPAIPYQHYQYQPGYSMATTNDGYPGATMAQLSFPSQVFVEHDTPSYMAYRSN